MTVQWRLTLVLVLVAALLAMNGVLCALLYRLYLRLKDEHRRATHVATIRGLVATLQFSIEYDGLPRETRYAIYAAMGEQFRMYDGAI